jgi:hypothetical protein
MKIYNELETLGFFEWLSETHNLRDTDMTPENLDKLQLNDIHRTVCDSMAFRWFREKYNLLATVYSNASGYLYEWSDSVGGTHRGWSNYEGPNDSGVWDTYEEAELACLKKLIEIVKEKK